MATRRKFLQGSVFLSASTLIAPAAARMRALPSNPPATRFVYSRFHKQTSGSDWQRLLQVISQAGRSADSSEVVVDRDIRLVDGDGTAILPAGVSLVPRGSSGTTIDASRLRTPIRRLFLLQRATRIGNFVLDVGDRVSDVVIDIPGGSDGCTIDVDEIAGTDRDPNAFGVWVRGTANWPTHNVRIRIGHAHGLRSGVQVRDVSDVEIHDSHFSDYGHRGVHAVTNRLDTVGLVVDGCHFGSPAWVRQVDSYARQPIGFNASDPANHVHRETTISDCTFELPGIPHNGTSAGRAERSRSSADALSLHRALDFRIENNRIVGSGELAINVSRGCRGGRIVGNRTENDDIGAISIGVFSDNTGANGGGIRNADVVVSDNNCERTVANALGNRPRAGQSALYAYSCDRCSFRNNSVTRHEAQATSDQVVALSATASTELSSCGMTATDFDRRVSEYESQVGTGPRDVSWTREDQAGQAGACN